MWSDLQARYLATQSRHILDLFEADPQRASNFSVETGDMRFDYSKTNPDSEDRAALIALC